MRTLEEVTADINVTAAEVQSRFAGLSSEQQQRYHACLTHDNADPSKVIECGEKTLAALQALLEETSNQPD